MNRTGERIRARRESLGWSQSELARQMRSAGWATYSQVAVSRTEDGTRDLRLTEAVSLSNILGLSLDHLAGTEYTHPSADATIAKDALTHAIQQLAAARDAL